MFLHFSYSRGFPKLSTSKNDFLFGIFPEKSGTGSRTKTSKTPDKVCYSIINWIQLPVHCQQIHIVILCL